MRTDQGCEEKEFWQQSSGFTAIEFDTRKNAVTFSKDCTGRLVSGKYTALDMHIYKGSEDNVFDYWFTDMRIPAPSVKKMLGYTSWYDHYQDIDEITECFNTSGDYDFMIKVYARDMHAYQQFMQHKLGAMSCLGSLHSVFVMAETKNTHGVTIL